MELNTFFLELLKLHERLNELFFRHQKALLSLDIDPAVEILWVYEEELLAHLKDEEELLLPLYQERAGKVPGGPVELFLGEHRKMRGFLQEFHKALVQMQGQEGSLLRHSIIALMDRQCMYKCLMEHHSLREKNILYPWLDRITSDEERALLLGQCRRIREKDAPLFTDR